MKKIRENKNKGFTLVELIVVLVILAILAAILVPSLLGYIERARDQQYIFEAKDLMTATQAGIAEAYALNKKSYINAVRETVCPSVSEKYGYYTNYALYEVANGRTMSVPTDPAKEKGTAAKNIISKRVVEYADSFKYDFNASLDNNHKVSSLGNKAGFVVLFSEHGRILYMQYARNGRLVTFDGKSFKVETGSNLQFVTFRN